MILAHTLGNDDDDVYRSYYEAFEIINHSYLTLEEGVKAALKIDKVN